MVEKISHDKSINEIQSDIIDLKLSSFKVDGAKDEESKLITKMFGNSNNTLQGKHLPFFYNEGLDIFTAQSTDAKYDNIKKYFTEIKYTVWIAFDIPSVLEELEDFLNVLDKPSGNNVEQRQKSKELLPRYKKMMRLKDFYETLVRFTLRCIHNYFWVDITKGVEKGAGVKNVSHCIKKVLPLVLKTKAEFEAEIEKEYPSDKYTDEFGRTRKLKK